MNRMPDNTELTQQLAQLTQSMGQLQENIQHLEGRRTIEEARDDTAKWMTWGKAAIGLVVFIIGIGINIGVNLYKLDAMDTRLASVEAKIEVIPKAWNTKLENEIEGLRAEMQVKIDKHESDILELQLSQAAQSPVITQIQKDVTEIKHDVKRLRKN